MQKTTIIEHIANLSSLYYNLNQSWSKDPCANDFFQVYRQEKYRDIYNSLNNINFDNIILEIIANSIDKKILNRLRGLIKDNILIYKVRQEDFKKIDFENIYDLWDEHLFAGKREIILRDRDIIKEYPYPTEREREMLIKENRKELIDLDNERYDLCRSDAGWISKKYYPEIHKISCLFNSIIENYYPTDENKEEKDKDKDKETTDDLQQEYYFDMGIVSAIHKGCNDEQFEDISELDLYAVLNLLPSNSQVTIKKGELNRIYYLIHKLYEYLPKDNSQVWRTGILNSFNLKERNYQSKYRLAKGRDKTPELVEFSKRLDDLFSSFTAL